MTQRAVGLLASSLLAWLAGRLLGIPELYVVAASGLALVVLAWLSVILAGSAVAVRRRVTAHRLGADERAEAIIDLRNDARLPTGLLVITDACPYALRGDQAADEEPSFVVPRLRPGQTVTLRYQLHGAGRGRFKVGPARIQVRDPFGLAQRTRALSATEEVVVYPLITPLLGSPRSAQRGGGVTQVRRLLGAGDEFHTMREYATGDDLRLVHWPSTAHRQTLMVRQNELPWQAQVTLLCDTRAEAHRGRGRDSTLERGISAAASIAAHMDETGFRLRLCNERDNMPGATVALEGMLDQLAVLSASQGQRLWPALAGLRRYGGDGLLIAVLGPASVAGSPADDADLRALLECGRSFGNRLGLVFDAPGSGSHPAELTGWLLAAGWRATTLAPGRPLDQAWAQLLSTPTSRPGLGARA